jgi:hypothetical protein
VVPKNKIASAGFGYTRQDNLNLEYLNMNQAYIIVGNTGEFDDAAKWNVGVHLDAQKAQEKVDELNRVAAEYGTLTPTSNYGLFVTISQKKVARAALEKAGDANGLMDTNGVRYSLEAVPLLS